MVALEAYVKSIKNYISEHLFAEDFHKLIELRLVAMLIIESKVADKEAGNHFGLKIWPSNNFADKRRKVAEGQLREIKRPTVVELER